MTLTFSDIDFASDIKDFISMSSDVSFSNESFKGFIQKCDDSQLLKITKTIDSPIKIVNVEMVDQEFITKNF